MSDERAEASEVAGDEATRVLDALGAIAARMRETAAELRTGKIHPAHAANRLDKLAREIDGRGPENTERAP